ncbi:hypothetical protein ACIGW1_18455 [Streptomyces sp. NPDC053780]|uniref:hypothetical protein n=1 Tax=unclassified Streptomyces TaxID=2593676 RepID=UPI0034461A63
MAAIALETTELETVVETAIRNRTVGLELLNMLRVENGKPAFPDRSYCTDHQSDVYGPALAGIQADLTA